VPVSDVERHLRDAGGELIESHRKAEAAIGAAARAGMSPEAIGEVSGLSAETVAAFLRQLGDTADSQKAG